jgi:hypothetical protein
MKKISFAFIFATSAATSAMAQEGPNIYFESDPESTPYMTQQFPQPPRYVQQLTTYVFRREGGRSFNPGALRRFVRGANPYSAIIMELTNPDTAYAPGVNQMGGTGEGDCNVFLHTCGN